ncbi:hypothetical protein B2J93_5084 [Marssonina coronariae]|uniref:SGNH hydrolase-type esterase domain-containing protein n=1 Tax=Diplocarpon coronariae TaxID=2795749 RepID=A0A218ZH59_9HELO|nr:hypothetical protein B2J93_5084 [Marssonina coronariae]
MRAPGLLAALGFLSTAAPLPFSDNILPDVTSSISGRELSNFQFRIAPLGASIVYGYPSTDKNGFRYGNSAPRKCFFTPERIKSEMSLNRSTELPRCRWGQVVGNASSGSMLDNENEGWPGHVIDQTYKTADNSILYQPNLVLLHVGSNDMTADNDVDHAHTRLARVIDKLFGSISGVTIIASTMLPRANAAIQARTQRFNGNIPAMVKERQLAGKKLLYVDFSSTWFSVSDLADDGQHPTDAGFLKMSYVWYQGIRAAEAQGWLTPPKAIGGLSDDPELAGPAKTCDKVPGNAVGPYTVQQGSGRDDGDYVHSASPAGDFSGFNNPSNVAFNNPLPEGVYWADINGDGVDDYVYVPLDASSGLGVALNNGDGSLGAYLYFPFTHACARSGVRFADMTGDGRHDFCCVQANGDLACSQNTPGTDPRHPNFVAGRISKSNEGYSQAQVRLADIDGDGRADYVAFSADRTKILGWRNGANQDGPPAYWTPMRGVFNDLPAQELSGWAFADLNGDHRDDLSRGVTHNFGANPHIVFGKFMGSGRADASRVSARPNDNVRVERFKNDGKGGTMVKGDGSRYCDMTGDGYEDYIWVSSTGEITLYGNNKKLDGTWDQWGVIYNANRPRREIQFADFDGDKKCDILFVEKATGRTSMLRNDFANGKFAFADVGEVTGNAGCAEGYGYHLGYPQTSDETPVLQRARDETDDDLHNRHDIGARWNDLDGDGRADFLCVRQNGTVTAFLNNGTGLIDKGQIKHSEGKERRNLRFADIDGDGRHDLLWLDPITGQMDAWKNEGPITTVDEKSSFSWTAKGMVAAGNTCRGSAVELVNVNGLGRADYYMIEPHENKATVMLNVCPGGKLGPVTPTPQTGAPPVPAISKPSS